jgi:hypothetical protein
MPPSLKQSVDRYSLSCRYSGGEPKIKFIKKEGAKNATCPKGTFRHGVVITCDGAEFDRKMTPPRRATQATAAKLPTTKEEKAAMAKVMLEEHNKFRTELKLKHLAWSDRLAELAAKWAAHLAKLGGKSLVSSNSKGQGENLWLGTAGSLNHAEMIRAWGAQKKHFIPGVYPKVSKTGDIADVRNYTQMIWGGTRLVGCGLGQAGGNWILVCRYWPPGNVVGHKPL